jgi:adenylate kinase family enzyme
MKVIGLIGEPAAGKSTVMRKLLERFGPSNVIKEGLVVHTVYPEGKVVVAGIYDEQVFSGTDRMSKACGPKVREWLTEANANPDYDGWTYYWEGERYSNSKFFDFFFNECPDVTVYFLRADEKTLNERNNARSQQNDSWRKGMRTRMSNLRNGYPVKIVEQGFELP